LKILKKVCKVWVFESKNPVFGSKSLGKVWKKFGKSSEKFWKSSLKFGILETLEILEIIIFQTFRNLRKNDVKLELWKSRKTRSDSKTNSKVWLKVGNAGPLNIITKKSPQFVLFYMFNFEFRILQKLWIF
jgi:hypothetical protein